MLLLYVSVCLSITNYTIILIYNSNDINWNASIIILLYTNIINFLSNKRGEKMSSKVIKWSWTLPIS